MLHVSRLYIIVFYDILIPIKNHMPLNVNRGSWFWGPQKMSSSIFRNWWCACVFVLVFPVETTAAREKWHFFWNNALGANLEYLYILRQFSITNLSTISNVGESIWVYMIYESSRIGLYTNSFTEKNNHVIVCILIIYFQHTLGVFI